MKLVLLSRSPRRIQLLTEAGWNPIVKPVNIDEIVLPDESPEISVQRLAKEKLLAYSEPWEEDTVYLAADTMVVYQAHKLGKPQNQAEAHQMLRLLSGKKHQVMTGVALGKKDLPLYTFVETTHVYFKELSDQQIEEYCNFVFVLDKAGAYAIQEHGDWLIERIEGSYTNVIGLPMERVTTEFARLGFLPSSNHYPSSIS